VVSKDVRHNVVAVSRTYHARQQRRDAFLAGPFNWLSSRRPRQGQGLLHSGAASGDLMQGNSRAQSSGCADHGRSSSVAGVGSDAALQEGSAAGGKGVGGHGDLPQQQQLMVKVRHGPSIAGCRLWLGSRQQVEAWGQALARREELPHPGTCTPAAAGAAGPEYGLVQLEEDDQGLAPGQYAVFYQDGLCLGAAKIVSPVVQQ
jgi:hypothetical protein